MKVSLCKPPQSKQNKPLPERVCTRNARVSIFPEVLELSRAFPPINGSPTKAKGGQKAASAPCYGPPRNGLCCVGQNGRPWLTILELLARKPTFQTRNHAYHFCCFFSILITPAENFPALRLNGQTKTGENSSCQL